MNHMITTADWQTDQTSLMKIREVVFMQEQQVSAADEWDGKDETAIHFIVKDPQDKVIACARVLVENNQLHIGRVAVLAEHRKQMIGRNLMQAVVAYCKQQYPNYEVYLHAQTTRQGFYEHLGFVAQGSVFMDAGIPHIEMWLS